MTDDAPRRGKPPPTEEFHRVLEEALRDPKTLPIVVGYAGKRCRFLRAVGLPGDDDILRELIQDAISDTATGVLTWDPTRCKLSDHLCGAVRHRTKGMIRHQKAFPMEALEDGYHGPGDRPDAEADAVRKNLSDRVLSTLFAMAEEKDDGAVQYLLMAYADGIEGRGDLADATGLSPDEVESAKKRLARLVDKLPLDLANAVRAELRGDR